MSSIYWIISGRVRASEQACKALTRSDDNGKKQDGKFLRFDRPEKKSLSHITCGWTLLLGMLCHSVTGTRDGTRHETSDNVAEHSFGKCCVILSLHLWLALPDCPPQIYRCTFHIWRTFIIWHTLHIWSTLLLRNVLCYELDRFIAKYISEEAVWTNVKCVPNE